MIAVEDAMSGFEVVEALADDPGVLAGLERERFYRAVRRAAAAHGGLVTAGTVRAELELPINPHRVGALMNGLMRSGVLVDTGSVTFSGDSRNRNARRRVPVWRLVDPEALP